jgi:SRSO17 transposase
MTEPRQAKPTVKFVDDYCQWYESLFPEVRSFEAFKHLHIGMLADIKRKSLPAIAIFSGARAGTIIASLSHDISLERRTVEGATNKANFTSFRGTRNPPNY